MTRVQSVLESGTAGTIIDIECHLSKSLPNIVIVGFASKSVDEAKERIRGAMASSDLKLPKQRITINLAPADIPKEGSYFDLPMLVSILLASKLVKKTLPPKTVILGEVGLDGSIRPIRGIIGKILGAREKGYHTFWIPEGNLAQASLVPDITLHSFSHTKDLYKYMNGVADCHIIRTGRGGGPPSTKQPKHQPTLDDVVGQTQAKRALIIAASGHHHIMLNGPPGTGKSMLAKALPSIMPGLTRDQQLEITHLHSLASKEYDKIIDTRPVRSPHHSSSQIAIVGGGQHPRPGEISLSHHGILFLDEFPEFNRSIVEALRQPLEDKKISVARAKDSVEFPANFLLIATANPCPCGYFESQRECTCLPAQIMKYQKRISGPIIDRIDLYITVDEVPHDRLLKQSNTKPNNYRETIEAVQKKQYKRSGKLNSELTNSELKRHAQLEQSSEQLFNTAADQMKLSARGYIRALRVARTIADLDGSDSIEAEHITEALQYRKRPVTL